MVGAAFLAGIVGLTENFWPGRPGRWGYFFIGLCCTLFGPSICFGSLLIIAAGVVCDLVQHAGAISFSLLLGHNRGILLLALVYFCCSRRVRASLNQPFGTQAQESPSDAQSDFYNPRQLRFWRDLAIYFMVFSVIGHLMERVYGIFTQHFLDIYDPSAPFWQDYLSPFNIYGIGAVVCILLLFPLKQLLVSKLKFVWLALLVSYLINTLAVTTIELVAGLFVNHPNAQGNLIYWYYSSLPFNFQGQICLQNALAFGMVATVMVWCIFPASEQFFLRCSNDTMNLVFVFVLVGYLLLTATYLIHLTLPPPATI